MAAVVDAERALAALQHCRLGTLVGRYCTAYAYIRRSAFWCRRLTVESGAHFLQKALDHGQGVGRRLVDGTRCGSAMALRRDVMHVQLSVQFVGLLRTLCPLAATIKARLSHLRADLV